MDKIAPVGFCLGERAGNTGNHAIGVVASDADGYKVCAVANRTVESDLNVGGIEDKVSDFGQRTVAPKVELSIEIKSKARDLIGGDIQAANFFEDFGDAASGDALEIHRNRPAGTPRGFILSWYSMGA